MKLFVFIVEGVFVVCVKVIDGEVVFFWVCDCVEGCIGVINVDVVVGCDCKVVVIGIVCVGDYFIKFDIKVIVLVVFGD